MQEKNYQGEISVTTEHIFPIIKRWLYSDKDIFLRELVSNASDAITKLSRLVSLGQAQGAEAGRIDVLLNEEAKTLTVRDNGIGMTREEVERYLNQIALSGALEFIEQYEGENAGGDGIIGHFGLGFYSAFMVASRVEVLTRSYTSAPAVLWTCTDAGVFEMAEGERAACGTDVVLHLSEEGMEYLKRERALAILEKYCAFLAYPIYLSEEGIDAGDAVNDTAPLWMKNPSEIDEEEYRAFYHKLFGYSSEPLFWVHLNADYPLNFKGILYFPQLKSQFDSMEGEVKLFYNRVFVADNISEVVPEYLLSLKGVLDCPELPLNVSRSFLQNSAYVNKLSAHISKKVSDKLSEILKNDRKRYEGFSQALRPFLQYGAIKDKKFFERVKALLLFETTDGEYLSLSEYLGDGEEKKVYYTTDAARQAQYIRLLKAEGKRILAFDNIMDTQYISFAEREEEGLSFVRVDSDPDTLTESQGESEVLQKVFLSVVPEGVEVKFAHLKDSRTAALFVTSENERRFADMMRVYSARGLAEMPDLPNKETLCVNLSCPVCEKLSAEKDGVRALVLAKQVYYTALISARSLKEEELDAFLENNYAFMNL